MTSAKATVAALPQSEDGVAARRARWSAQWKQFRRSRMALPGLVLFAIFVLTGLLAPLVSPYNPYDNDLANVMTPPSLQHWFGTDELGRDMLTRILFGARISLVEGVLSAAIAAAIGIPIGMLSGYAGKRLDAVIMRLIDVLLAFPGVLLAIVIISILGPSLANAILAVAIYTVPIFARFARGQTLAVKQEPYIEACRAIGMSNLRILVRHIFPNIAATISALATLRVGINILTCASLSFLGLGAQAPLPEWGAMLANSRTTLLIAPHLALFPGMAILLLVFGLNLFQDGLQVVLDPKDARPVMNAAPPLLSIEALRTVFATDAGELAAVDGVDLEVHRGQTLGIVGESGCGKSMLALSVMGLVPSPGRTAAGRIVFDGEDLTALPPERLRELRGKRIAMVFQEPMTSLNPVYTVGFQIVEAMRAHEPSTPVAELKARAIAALERVRITAAAQRFNAYPHQLSGGMRQRVMIAMALACSPDLLIADEPTTALDVTVQAQVLDLLADIQRETRMAIILITHDLGVVAGMANEVAVMYAGRVVERAPVASIFDDPQHPYTLGLLGSMPRVEEQRERLLVIEGSLPPPGMVQAGCRFHPRCVFGTRKCVLQDPPLRPLAPGHGVACIHAPVEVFAAAGWAEGVA